MSNTPKTDSCACDVNYKGNFVYCDDGQLVEIGFARELERENAALKEALDAQANYQRELRADRDRLDWILSDHGGSFVFWNYDIDEWKPELKATRDWIDVAMGVRKL